MGHIAARTPLAGRLLIALLVLASMGGCTQSPKFRGTAYEPPSPAPEISGVNWDGSAFRLSAIQDRVALIFFGYTYCPDVCPLTLSEMKTLYRELGADASEVAVVFVSVDPERDSVARLAEYIPVFDRRFYGVHIGEGALEHVKQAYGVIAEKHYYDPDDSAAGYSVDHTARLYIVDRAGRLRLSFAFGSAGDDIRSDVKTLLREKPSQGDTSHAPAK